MKDITPQFIVENIIKLKKRRMSGKNLTDEDVKIIEKETEKIDVLASDDVNVETISMNEFE